MIKKHKSVRESFDEFIEESKKKFWAVIVIITIFMFIPDFVDKIKWYIDHIPKMIDLIDMKKDVDVDKIIYVYTTNERTPLRENADAKAKKLLWLLIDTKLRIINDIPRWYEVEYTNEDGIAITGWVAKRSVEIGD